MDVNLCNPDSVRRIMSKAGLKFNKSLGQNFLVDESVLRKIVDGAGVSKDMLAIEIGPGIGVLTQELAKAAGKVIAVELDRNLAQVLRQNFVAYDNVEIIEADAMKFDFAAVIDRPACVVANLPYYITTPILMRLLESGLALESITVMVQKEVAERIAADPGGKEYGALSVAVQYYSKPSIICMAPSDSFMPPPKVDSCVVRLDVRKDPPVGVEKERLFKVVKAAFGQRRKTLCNALQGGLGMGKDDVKAMLGELGFDEKIRGERLSLEDFARIAERIDGDTPRMNKGN